MGLHYDVTTSGEANAVGTASGAKTCSELGEEALACTLPWMLLSVLLRQVRREFEKCGAGHDTSDRSLNRFRRVRRGVKIEFCSAISATGVDFDLNGIASMSRIAPQQTSANMPLLRVLMVPDKRVSG
jgi:hypothetical protein